MSLPRFFQKDTTLILLDEDGKLTIELKKAKQYNTFVFARQELSLNNASNELAYTNLLLEKGFREVIENHFSKLTHELMSKFDKKALAYFLSISNLKCQELSQHQKESP